MSLSAGPRRLSLGVVRYDNNHHGCMATDLNKLEQASLHMVKYNPMKREEWSESFIEYAEHVILSKDGF